MALPVTELALQRYCDPVVARAVATEADSWSAGNSTLATFLDLLAAERARQPDSLDLVWSGPEADGAACRDTGAVLRELFLAAELSVLVAGYAVHHGQEVFCVLADRMDRVPDLVVRMVLDIQRGRGDTTIDIDVVARFAERWRRREWPGQRMPEVFYNPRSLAIDQAQRSAMHAKCVVIDRKIAFVSSANFTLAAQRRNIEVGLIARAPTVAALLTAQFDGLVANGTLRPLPLR